MLSSPKKLFNLAAFEMELYGIVWFVWFEQLKNVLRVLRDFQIGKALQIESAAKFWCKAAALRPSRPIAEDNDGLAMAFSPFKLKSRQACQELPAA